MILYEKLSKNLSDVGWVNYHNTKTHGYFTNGAVKMGINKDKEISTIEYANIMIMAKRQEFPQWQKVAKSIEFSSMEHSNADNTIMRIISLILYILVTAGLVMIIRSM